MRCLGAGLGLGSGWGFGSGSRLRRTSVRRCEGAGAGSVVFPVRWWWGGGGGADGPGLGAGGPEPLAEGLRVVGGAEALDRVAEEGLSCRLRHDGLRGGLVWVGGVALRTSSKVCTMCNPSCLPAPPAHFTQRRSSCKARGGEGSELEVLERRGGDVDLQGGRGWRCLGELERRWRGLGVEDGYQRRGEQEGEVDMGRRWREWWWRGLGVVDGYGRRGEWGARWGLCGEGEVDVGRRWRALRRRGERERWRWELGVGVAGRRSGERVALRGSWGEGEVDMGRRWRLGERERREQGPRGFAVAPWGAGAARVGG